MPPKPVAEWVEQWGHVDAPRRDESDRYAIYTVKGGSRTGAEPATPHRRLCETSLDGIGRAILSMLEEGEVPEGWRVGVLDRLTRQFLVNPFA